MESVQHQIYRYDKFIKVMRQRVREKEDENNIIIISGEIKVYKHGTDAVTVEERRAILEHFEKFMVNRPFVLGVAKAYGDIFVSASYASKDISMEILNEKIDKALDEFVKQIKQKFSSISVNIFTGLNLLTDSIIDISVEFDNANYARQLAEKRMRRIVVFNKDMLESRLRSIRYVNEFEAAIEEKEFQVYYQPKVDALSGNVVGGEALVRWIKPDGTIISPDSFIELFEKSGMIVRLDYYVYEEVFKYIRKNLDANKITVPISMNVSRVHMDDEGLTEYIKGLIDKYQVPVKYLEFEITENVCVLRMENTLKFIEDMHSIGVKISMDDFGSGYSSLNLLSEVPVDILKVDKGFFKNRHNTKKEKIVMESILSMAKKLHIAVVCEGIEYQEQSKFLILSGCEMLQGFYYSRPVPEKNFEEYICAHLADRRSTYIFEFQHNFSDVDHIYEGEPIGSGLEFVSGHAKGVNVLHFSGEGVATGCVEIPRMVCMNGDFSVSMWIKDEEPEMWTSVFYADYENSFFSIMPLGKEQRALFRFKDKENEPWWGDIISTETIGNKWTHLVGIYNSVEDVTSFYVNGILQKSIDVEKKPEVVERILIGGDIYKRSFKGCIGEMIICDHPLNILEVNEIYQKGKKVYC